MTRGPRRRTGLLERELRDELIVVDPERRRAHCLQADAAAIWRACDGTRTVPALAEVLSRHDGRAPDDESAVRILEDLRAAELLEPAAGLTRREVTRAVATAGALGLLTPLISTIALPSPLDAQSGGNGDPCDENSDCASNCCSIGGRCKPDDGRCRPDPLDRGLLGEPCLDDDDCLSDRCSPGGLCQPSNGLPRD